MIALLKKDFRNNLTPIVASVLALMAPYLIAICIWCMTEPTHRGMGSHWMFAAAIPSFWITAVLAATYGGAAFANERHERSADFLAMMPVTRDQIILSKTLTAFGCIGSMSADQRRRGLQQLSPLRFVGFSASNRSWLC